MSGALKILSKIGPELGIHQVSDSILVEILEKEKTNALVEPLAVISREVIEPATWRSGPVFTARISNGFVDLKQGFVFDSEGRPIRETFVIRRFLDQLDQSGDSPIGGSVVEAPEGIGSICAVINQRSTNYCHWLQDVVSKAVLFSMSDRRIAGRNRGEENFAFSRPSIPFQSWSLSLFEKPLFFSDSNGSPQYLKGEITFSAGMSSSGALAISPLIRHLAPFIRHRWQDPQAHAANAGASRRLYISRSKARMRRITNEDLLLPVLHDFGFEVVCLEDLDVGRQIAIFQGADVVVAPHGAGLTNILFCSPGTLVIEAFPEGGFHQSAFWRYASVCGLRYAYMSGGVTKIHRNPSNCDFVLDPASLRQLLVDLL